MTRAEGREENLIFGPLHRQSQEPRSFLPLEDYLLPHENIRFQSDFDVMYAGKLYLVILTDTRLVLYSRRGFIFQSDDVVTEAIHDIQGITYKERGLFVKTSSLEVLGHSKIVLEGKQAAIKALYQRLLPFLSPELRIFPSSQDFPPAAELTPPTPPAPRPIRHCPDCGIELFPEERFCHNCGHPLD